MTKLGPADGTPVTIIKKLKKPAENTVGSFTYGDQAMTQGKNYINMYYTGDKVSKELEVMGLKIQPDNNPATETVSGSIYIHKEKGKEPEFVLEGFQGVVISRGETRYKSYEDNKVFLKGNKDVTIVGDGYEVQGKKNKNVNVFQNRELEIPKKLETIKLNSSISDYFENKL